MSILERIADLFQAKTHKLLSRLEDPNETLDLSYERMLTGLQETRRHLADVVTERTSLERQIAAGRAEAERAENDARLAIRSDREDLARAALAHKQAALAKLDTLAQARNAIAAQADKLIEYQSKLEARIEQFRNQKEVMKSTYAAAQAQVRVTESLTGIGSDLGNVGGALQRAQDKVEGMQARAGAMEGMLEAGILTDPLDPRSATDHELDKLRATGAIDADMARLKAELGGETGGKALPAP
ncbi:PspA/IM30 family protein [Labrys wisconsinensis]|uniref:Phage shock protein A n=1 Tax=Labrys wisconsinensis TaxID=425677 RepID=A0ABU0JDN8_9HYPH|nr:PspA/IM30 family protein [Labrys wisconsinensis]MDQ0472402.1 phage shock protein A [Labrys wisconsinensis]